VFYDTEAVIEHEGDRREHHHFRLGWACLATYTEETGLQVQEWRRLRETKDLWKWVTALSRDCKDLWVIAHNIGYDARISRAFYHLPTLGWEPSGILQSRSCTLFPWERGKRKLTLLDNMNIWHCSLADLGESVGLEKLNVDFDNVGDEELSAYCYRDVEILVRAWQSWLSFLDEHNLGSLGITIGQQAMTAYRHKFLMHKIIINNDAELAGLERDALHGGRTECFFIGNPPPGTYYKLDVNGLYAAMMKWYEYPWRNVKILHSVSVDYLDYLLEHYLIIAEVVVEAEEPIFCKALSGRNAYPTGQFLTTLTTPELKLALISGRILGVGRVALYEGADLFSEYIDFLTPLRQMYKAAGDVARARMCKEMRNALEGKFAQRGYKQEVLGDAPRDKIAVTYWRDGESERTCTDWTFGGKVVRESREGEGYNSFPAIPAHICANARVYMWSLIMMAGQEHVFYTDTDSLFVDYTGFCNLSSMIDPLKLGYLKLEGTATNLEIRAKKDYHFGTADVIKGIKSDAVRLAPDLFEQWHFTSLRYAFQAKDLSNVTLFKMQKKLDYSCVAGTIGADGWVCPPHLHVNPKDLFCYLADWEHDKAWIWEFDKDWLESVGRLDRLVEKPTYEMHLLSSQSPLPAGTAGAVGGEAYMDAFDEVFGTVGMGQ